MTAPLEKFGERLRRLRIRVGLSQANVAMICNVLPRQVSRWELGRWPRRKSRIDAICSALAPKLGCTPFYLRWGRDVRRGDIGVIIGPEYVPERPRWSYPDELLLQECREAREEIIRAEGYRRQQP